MKSGISKEFVIKQYYTAAVDESAINNVNYSDAEADWVKEDTAKWHRMLQAILANEEVLTAVCTFKTLVQYGVDCNDTVNELLEDHYGNKDTELPHILARFAHIFTQEDRDWLLEIIKEHKEFMSAHGHKKAYWDLPGYLDLGVQIDTLADCFEVEVSGWNISRLRCKCESEG